MGNSVPFSFEGVNAEGLREAMKVGAALAEHQSLSLQTYGGESVPMVVHPADWKVSTFEALLARPLRAKGVTALKTEAAFVDFVRRYGNPAETQIIADVETEGAKMRFLATFDFQRARPAAISAKAQDGESAGSGRHTAVERAWADTMERTVPGWCEHRATLTIAPSIAWAEWLAADGTWMAPGDFATFLEDRNEDVAEPFGGALVEMVRDFRASKSTKFRHAFDEANGAVTLQVETAVEAQGSPSGRAPVTFPAEMKLGLAPFRGAPHFAVRARLRFRVGDSGGLSMSYKLIGPDRAYLAAGDEVLARMREALPDFCILEGACG